MNGILWSQTEIDFLHDLSGTDERNALIRKFQRKARKEGWPDRTSTAIAVKMKKLKISYVAELDGLSCTGLGKILGIERDRVHDWVERGLLRSRRLRGRRHHRIMSDDFVEFAKRNPEWLTDIPREGLAYFLDEETVQLIQSQKPRTRGVAFQIRHAVTGKVYRSLHQAEREEYLSRAAIVGRINKGEFQILQRGKA